MSVTGKGIMEKKNESFDSEISNTADTLTEKRKEADLVFAVVADSHLDDFEEDTLSNIRAVDRSVKFDFIIHLGDFLNGSLSRRYAGRILAEEMERYRMATENGVFYPVQGNHDGFCQIEADKQVSDMALDEDWYEATEFIHKYANVKRKGIKPYFYVDYPAQKVRLVILCSFSYEWTEEGAYRKLYQMDSEEIEWLKEEALVLESDWTVMLFSHDGPLQLYEETKYDEEPWKGNSKELFQTVMDSKERCGYTVAAWFVGHWHGELCRTIQGIPFVLVGSQTCYVPQLWNMPEAGHFEKRERGTVTQDLWDGAVLNCRKRELYLCRFGAGKDRVIYY